MLRLAGFEVPDALTHDCDQLLCRLSERELDKVHADAGAWADILARSRGARALK